MSVEDILESLPGKSSLVELGKIKIGGKSSQNRTSSSGGSWRAPVKYDHFVLTTMNRDAAGDLIEDKALMDQLKGKYGDGDGKLRRIPIRLLSDDIDDVIQSAFVWYGGKTVGARSDGTRVLWNNNPKDGTKYNPPYEDDWKPEMLDWKNSKGVKLFKPHTNFSCVIAAEEARWGGVYKFRTTSIISLRQLHGSLLHLSQLTGGILVGMPLMLCVRPMQVAPEGKATTVHVVHVELRGGDLMQLQEKALQMAQFRLQFKEKVQQTTRQYRRLLTGPGMESDDEAKDIAEEFEPTEEIPEVQTVPTGQGYALLEGAVIDRTDAQEAPTDIDGPEIPTENEAIERGDEGQPAGALDPIFSDPVAAQKRVESAAKDHGASMAQIKNLCARHAIKLGHGPSPAKIEPGQWLALLEAVAAKRVNLETGEIIVA